MRTYCRLFALTFFNTIITFLGTQSQHHVVGSRMQSNLNFKQSYLYFTNYLLYMYMSLYVLTSSYISRPLHVPAYPISVVYRWYLSLISSSFTDILKVNCYPLEGQLSLPQQHASNITHVQNSFQQIPLCYNHKIRIYSLPMFYLINLKLTTNSEIEMWVLRI